MALERIEPTLRVKLFTAFCADEEIRDLVIRGTKFGRLEDEPVYDPDKKSDYVSKEIDAARSKAEALSRAIAPELDTSHGDFGTIFLEARFEITKHLKR